MAPVGPTVQDIPHGLVTLRRFDPFAPSTCEIDVVISMSGLGRREPAGMRYSAYSQHTATSQARPSIEARDNAYGS
jgi:hypothetical protein